MRGQGYLDAEAETVPFNDRRGWLYGWGFSYMQALTQARLIVVYGIVAVKSFQWLVAVEFGHVHLYVVRVAHFTFSIDDCTHRGPVELEWRCPWLTNYCKRI